MKGRESLILNFNIGVRFGKTISYKMDRTLQKEIYRSIPPTMKEDTVASLHLKNQRNRRLQFYREQNANFESIFGQCKLVPGPLSAWDLTNNYIPKREINQLCTAQENLNIKELDAPDLAMSFVDQEGEKNTHKEKLKSDTNILMGITEELLGEFKELSREIMEARKHIEETKPTSEDLYQVDKKNLAYRNDLAKFDKKHPWLKNPQLDLTYIARESQSLANMQEEKEALEKELEVYQGLKPDLQEAFHQLSVVKKQYKELKDNFHQGV